MALSIPRVTQLYNIFQRNAKVNGFIYDLPRLSSATSCMLVIPTSCIGAWSSILKPHHDLSTNEWHGRTPTVRLNFRRVVETRVVRAIREFNFSTKAREDEMDDGAN